MHAIYLWIFVMISCRTHVVFSPKYFTYDAVIIKFLVIYIAEQLTAFKSQDTFVQPKNDYFQSKKEK